MDYLFNATKKCLKRMIKYALSYHNLTQTAAMQNDDMEDILLDFDHYRKTELIDYYVEDLERLAAEAQVTVDYYIAEFV
jgi:hypothetical protein